MLKEVQLAVEGAHFIEQSKHLTTVISHYTVQLFIAEVIDD